MRGSVSFALVLVASHSVSFSEIELELACIRILAIVPAHEKEVIFEVTQLKKHVQYEGPWRFIDVARCIATVLVEAGEILKDTSPYRLIKDVASF